MAGRGVEVLSPGRIVPPPLASGTLAAIALAIVALHATCLTHYGWFRDELYYLSCAKRLAWGYVDQPPLSIALLAAVIQFAGDSLTVLRQIAAQQGAALAFLTGVIARELGGRRAAQAVAALTVGVAPILLGVGHYYSMNALDFVIWALATLLAMRAIERDGPKHWVALGGVLGLGLLNKWSVAWLGAGLLAGILVSPRRGVLLSRGPWIAAAITALMLAPHLLWQARHDWPTLEFMSNARSRKMVALEPARFLFDHLLTMGPGAAPIWIAGLIACLRVRPARRVLPAAIFIVTLAILFASGSARVEYLALACPALFAAGAVWWEARGRRALVAVAAVAVVLAIPLMPFALPILPVQTFIAYQNRLGLAPRSEERHRMGTLPQHYADMFGWPELADSVARAAARLSPAERERAIVIVDNYGEAGALERFGAGRLPRIVSQHNNWYLWGPSQWDGSAAILVGRDSSEVAEEFDSVTPAGRAGHPLAMPYERDLAVVIARGFHADLAKAWVQGKHFQ